MLSTDQKVTILRKAGISFPAFPARRLMIQKDASTRSDEREADAEERAKEWKNTINVLYLDFVASNGHVYLGSAKAAAA